MKKLLITTIAALALAACSEQVELTTETVESVSFPTSKNRSIAEVWNIANQILSQDVTSRSGQRLKPASDIKVVCSETSRSGETDTLYYAVDLEDNGGFMLIAAPYNVEPVMAIIDEGSFAAAENLKNEAYQQILSIMTENVINAAETNDPAMVYSLKPLIPADTYFDTYTEDLPRVEVAWHQGYPENVYAPNGVAGCAPVAMAMLLSYFEEPKSITYTCKDLPVNYEPLNWTEIKKHKRSYYDGISQTCADCNASYTAHNTLSNLVRELGHRANTEYIYIPDPIFEGYPVPATGTNLDSMAIVIKEITNRDYIKNGTTFDELYTNLKSNPGVALIAGYGVDNNTGKHEEYYNHAWIADGYKETIRVWQRYGYDEKRDNIYFKTENELYAKLMHFNWGNGGVCNGYFNIVNLTDNYVINPHAGSPFDFSDHNTPDDDIVYTNYVTKYWLYQ